ncbi:MAG: hypothetical protein JWO59_2955 [Chloroflexi bacterium]|nr:hypothetical protein [Chloroflexota bacterium]
MVPLRLRLYNFLSYGVEGGDLDLRPIHMACLSGGNGHGKSALVDAITWSLWGRSRAAREDDLLRHGTTEMEVEFEFASNHAVYRVIRKRSVRKGGSTATLELAVRDGDTYRAITGNTIADSERAISKILRLSYETFINSSLLLQGRADLFTVKRPAERKEILGEILGLGQYESLAEQARERERQHRSVAEHLRARVEELDTFLAAVPGLQVALATAEQELATVQTERSTGERHVEERERSVQTLLGLRDALERLDLRLATIAQEEAEAQRQRQRAQERTAAAQALLEDEQGIRERLALLQRLRQENDRLAGLVNDLRTLESHAAECQREIATEHTRISLELKAEQTSLDLACAAVKDLHRVEGELVLVKQRHAGLATLQAERQVVTERINQVVETLGGLRASIAGLSSRRKELRERILSLKSAGAICPTCGTTLDEQRRAEAHEAAMQEGIASKTLMEREQLQEASLAVEQQQVQAVLDKIERSIAEAQVAGRREAELEEKARAFRALAERQVSLAESVALLTRRLDIGEFASDARISAAAIERQIVALAYDREAHAALTAQIRGLAPVEAQLAALDQARMDLQSAALAGNTAETRLVTLGEERGRIVCDQEPLRDALTDLPAKQQALLESRAVVQQLRNTEGDLQHRLGSLRSQLDDARKRAADRATAAASAKEAEQQAWAHKELAVIFGKRGIQAMLIENALPELEQDANELLARMTDNSTQVQFATQRTGSGGKAIETLEIKIADTMGTRTYEMFSGGEAFRINFAIRIALSKLLARRAGADLSFLLVDEGFGTQDSQGRDRLVEAIGAIAEDFEKILVVTHIDELRDQFDVHVEISKGPGGSQISVSAA